MNTMKVMRFNDAVAAPGLIRGTAAVPQPGPGEMLVRVKAAGVTTTELHWYPTTHTKDGAERTGAIPGHEFSGVVEAVGSKADPGQIGREVFGLNDWSLEAWSFLQLGAQQGAKSQPPFPHFRAVMFLPIALLGSQLSSAFLAQRR